MGRRCTARRCSPSRRRIGQYVRTPEILERAGRAIGELDPFKYYVAAVPDKRVRLLRFPFVYPDRRRRRRRDSGMKPLNSLADSPVAVVVGIQHADSAVRLHRRSHRHETVFGIVGVAVAVGPYRCGREFRAAVVQPPSMSYLCHRFPFARLCVYLLLDVGELGIVLVVLLLLRAVDCRVQRSFHGWWFCVRCKNIIANLLSSLCFSCVLPKSYYFAILLDSSLAVVSALVFSPVL